jgi:basic membrane protein A
MPPLLPASPTLTDVLFMKRSVLLVATIALLASVAGCSRQTPRTEGSAKVGLVFDVGGRGDKSFNDAAFRGLEEARDSLGIGFEYLIIGVGFIFTDDITAIAREFPDKRFACIDYTVDSSKSIPSNLVALEFREEEGSFLVGALAALVTKTNIIGFVGGMQSPLIRKFEVAYRAGAAYANPRCTVLVGYAGVTGEAFKNPGKGKELALGQYDQGADIIYHASGVTGLGVFEAARLRHKLAIGVDSDQEHEAPGYILTSMTKIVDHAVFETIKAFKESRFQGGHAVTFGLKNGGVDYVYDRENRGLIPPEVHEKVEAIRRKIIDGEIVVPYR